MEDKSGLFSRLSPKASFFAGLSSAFVLFFVVGFFVLLGILISDRLANQEKPNQEVAGTQDDTGQEYTEIILDPVSDFDWIRGNKDAKVTLIEYSDVECPYCKRFHDTTKQLLEKYQNELRIVFRHMPLTSLHPNSSKDAEAAECVGDIGGEVLFWKYLDLLFETDLASIDQLSDLAVKVGLNKKSFEECLSSGKYAKKVNAHLNSGSSAAESSSYTDSDPENDGMWGTPFSVIVSGDQKIPVPGAYPIEYLASTIDSLIGN